MRPPQRCWKLLWRLQRRQVLRRPVVNRSGPRMGRRNWPRSPFFVRGKVRRNTESFARERGIGQIDAETLYDAKAHFSR